MFGSLGYWASSKGMVSVPDVSGMTEEEASTALSNVVLSYSLSTTTQTSNLSLVDKVASQSISSGTLVSYESVIQISLYSYVCNPNWTQYEISRSSTTWSGNCVNNVEAGTYTIFYSNVDSNGCEPSYSSQTVVNTTRSCTPPCVPNWQSSCSDGSVSWSGNCVNNVESGTYVRTCTVTDTSGCNAPYTTTQTLSTTRGCTPCASLPNYTVREYEYYPYSQDCQWRYVYDTTYTGCGVYVTRVFLGKGIICA